MNSRVSVEAKERQRREPAGDQSNDDNVVFLPPKDNPVASPSRNDDCVPITVNNVPVYISQTASGSPLYIREYLPTLEELMVTGPSDNVANFDGFSEASGSAFEGFSEGSRCSSALFEGFSEGNQCNSALFEGFSEGSRCSSALFEGFSEGSRCSSVLFEGFSDEHDVKNNFVEELGKALATHQEEETDDLGNEDINEKDENGSDSCTPVNSRLDICKQSVGNINAKQSVRSRRSNCTSKYRRSHPKDYLPGGIKRSNSVESSLNRKKIKQEENEEMYVKTNKLPSREDLGPFRPGSHKNIVMLPCKARQCVEKGGKDGELSISNSQNLPAVIPQNARQSINERYEDQKPNSSPQKITAMIPQKARRSIEKRDNESVVEVTPSGRPKRLVTVSDNFPAPGDYDYIGEHCNSVGCTISFLESMAVKRVRVNNGIVYEFDEFAKRICWDKSFIVKWLQRLTGIKNKDKEPESQDLDKINAILKRRKALVTIYAGQKSGAERLKSFDTTEFILPSSVNNEVKHTDTNEKVKPLSKGATLPNVQIKSGYLCQEKQDCKQNVPVSEFETTSSKAHERNTAVSVQGSGKKCGNKKELRRSVLENDIGSRKNDRITIKDELYNETTEEIKKECNKDEWKGTKKGEKRANREERGTGIIKNQGEEGTNEKGEKGTNTKEEGKESDSDKGITAIDKMNDGKGTNKDDGRKRPKREEEEREMCKRLEGKGSDGKQEGKIISEEVRKGNIREEDKRETRSKGTSKEKGENKYKKEGERKEMHRAGGGKSPNKPNREKEPDKEGIETNITEQEIGTMNEGKVTHKEEEQKETKKGGKRTKAGERGKQINEEEEKILSEEGGGKGVSRESKGKESDGGVKEAERERRNSSKGRVKEINKEEGKEGMKEEERKKENNEVGEKETDEEKGGKEISKGGGKTTNEEKIHERRRKEMNKGEIKINKEEGRKEIVQDGGGKGSKERRGKEINEERGLRGTSKEERGSETIKEEDGKTEKEGEKTNTPVAKGDMSGSTKGKEPKYRDVQQKDQINAKPQKKERERIVPKLDENFLHEAQATAPKKRGRPRKDTEGLLRKNQESHNNLDGKRRKKEGKEGHKESGKVLHKELCPVEDRDSESLHQLFKEVSGSKSSQKQKQPCKEETEPVDSSTSPSLSNTPKPQKPQVAVNTYDGTLGVSKSGRLRKPSAKGVQSIEIKCLFMQKNATPSVATPTCKQENTEMPASVKLAKKDVLSEKTKKGHSSPKERRPFPVYSRTDNQYITYTFRDGHLVPKFRETNYYLGDYCFDAGVTVDDLNSDEVKDVAMTFGMIKELHDFYVSRKAPKTSLAIRLFQMNGKKILDNTHLLSTVIRITNVSATKYSDFTRLSREFRLPNRITYVGQQSLSEIEHSNETKDNGKIVPKPEKTPAKMSEVSQPLNDTKRDKAVNKKRAPKRRCHKPEDDDDDESYEYYCDQAFCDDDDLYNEIFLTQGKEGTITRGDIVHLYTKWLRNKMTLGSNVFVTDLLKSVEQLMLERKVGAIRVPAGTLMSSSVRLHDEYKQMLRMSKEDAIMYLEEDWLEDIQYLLSVSAPPRRNTTDGESAPDNSGPVEIESVRTVTSPNTSLKDNSEVNKSLNISEGEAIGKFRSLKAIPQTDRKESSCDKVQTRNYMESVGKRQSKRKSVRESLEAYDTEILSELREKEGMLLEEEKEDMEVAEMNMSVRKRNEGANNFSYEVEKIVGYQELHKNKEKHVRYLVRWLGFGPEDDSWVHEGDLHCPKILQAYWENIRNIKESPKCVAPKASTEKNVKKSPKSDITSHTPASVGKIVKSPKSCLPPASPEKAVRSKSYITPSSAERKVRGRRSGIPPAATEKNIKKSPKSDIPPASRSEQGCKSPRGTGGLSNNVSPKTDNEESLIQVMVQHGAAQRTVSANEEQSRVTKRELLSLYDSWRQENQNDLMAGGSSTVNLEVFKSRIKDLMTSRNITDFHPESLLNACFMMTLMRTRLQSKMAIDKFLDSSCLEVLESSHKQYLKRQNSQVKETTSKKPLKEKKKTVLSLQNELLSLKADLSSAKRWRAMKSSQLGAVEEEVHCLETVVNILKVRKRRKSMILQQELEKIKEDLRVLENKQMPVLTESEQKDILEAKHAPLFDKTECDSENYKRNSKIVQRKLLKLNIPRNAVDSIMDVVARKVTH